MPGKLYSYVNFGTIKRNIGTSKVKSFARPLLRDIEWNYHYNVTEARGFSGFILDEEYTSLHMVKELNEIGVYEPTDYIKKNFPYVIDDRGLLKKYIPPRENLCKIHDYNKGRPLYDNQASNIIMMGPRDYGKSYLNC
jgi:hypothetical protein